MGVTGGCHHSQGLAVGHGQPNRSEARSGSLSYADALFVEAIVSALQRRANRDPLRGGIVIHPAA
jgi:hypothetical protein